MNKIQKRKKQGKINLALINKFITALVIVCGIYYIAGVNDLSIKGFALQELKREVKSNLNENNQLAIKAADLESYENLNSRLGELTMVPAEKIDYIAVAAELVAKR